MEATNVASCGIVQEVLTKDNYKRWKILMKNYLLGKNLWAVVESDSVSIEDGTREMDAENRRMNAKALHIIQLSCGSKIFDEISGFATARDAWNHLAVRYGCESKAEADIEQGVKDDNLVEYKDLYWYVKRGDWTNAESFIKKKKGALFSAMASGKTVLHVATMEGHVIIVDGLVAVGGDRLVEMQDERGYTALALAAHYTGNVDIARCLVEEKGGGVRQNLLAIKNEDGEIPVVVAAGKGHKEMTRYLYYKTPMNMLNGRDSRNRVLLLARCIEAEIFDVSLGLLKSYPELPTESLSDGFRALHALAQMPSAFLSGCRYGLRERIIYHSGPPSKIVYPYFLPVFNIFGAKKIYEQKCIHYEVGQILRYLKYSVAMFSNSQLHQGSVYDAMLHAAKHGIVEFINAMAEANPDLLWAMDSRKRGIFSYAVLHRKLNVFKLIYTINGRKDIIKCGTDVFGNNLLHLARHLGHSSEFDRITGAALQMQRELLWFKAVKKVVHPKCKEARNDDDKKPHELFTETHEELVKSGEQWAKETARSLTLVGTLITTIMFAAAFTIKREIHPVPALEALSLTFSAISVMMFIWIQTARYAEQDFLTLPSKFARGLFFLYMSICYVVGSLIYIVLAKHKLDTKVVLVMYFILFALCILLTLPLLRLIREVRFADRNLRRIKQQKQ